MSQVYEEGRSRGWPGIGQEVVGICHDLGIPDVNQELISKKEVKQSVYILIYEHHHNNMVETLKDKSVECQNSF